MIGLDEFGVREVQEPFAGAFSFGGGVGGGCFEEPAANLNTLREAKREEDEVGCFWLDPEPLVVAIVVQLREGGGGRESDEVSGRKGVAREA